MNNKGKIILVVFIGIIALVAIIGAAVLVNDIPSKMSVNGSYISTMEMLFIMVLLFRMRKFLMEILSTQQRLLIWVWLQFRLNLNQMELMKMWLPKQNHKSLHHHMGHILVREIRYVWQALMKLWISNFIYQTISLFTNRMLSNRKKLWKVYLKMKNTVQYWHLCVH